MAEDSLSWRTRLTRPLTPSEHARIRVGLALLPVVAWLFVSWTTYAIDTLPSGRLDGSGHVKGHDFIHFYVIGEIARERASRDLYSFEAHAARNDRVLPDYPVRYLPVHAPQVALFFAPLATRDYLTALTIWLLFSAVLYGLFCGLMWSALSNLRPHAWAVALCAAAFPAFYALIAAGQTSAVALLCVTLAYLSFRGGRPTLAGVCLGTLVYKPTLGLVLPFVFLYGREWRVIVGAAIAVVVQFGVAWAYFGSPALMEYVANFIRTIQSIDALEAQPWQMHSLRSFFTTSLPWPQVAAALQLAASVVVIVFAARTWKSGSPLPIRFAVLLIATMLVDPHVYTYELVLLAPAFLIAASVALEGGRMAVHTWVLLYLAYCMPALPTLAVATRVQWSVPALIALMLVLGWTRSEDEATHVEVA